MKVKITRKGVMKAKNEEFEVGTVIDVPGDKMPGYLVNKAEIVGDMVANPKQEDDQEIEKLRADYKELTGKKADGRWSVEKLTEEIEKAAE